MKEKEMCLKSLRRKFRKAGSKGPVRQRQRINVVDLEGEEAILRDRMRAGRSG